MLELPQESGDSTGCHLPCPPATAPVRARGHHRCSLSQGASWERGEKWKSVFKTPQADELSPVWGVSSLPASACLSVALQGSKEEEEDEDEGSCGL